MTTRIETTELEVARRAAQVGGDVVTSYFREGVDVRQKGGWNLVSDADVESEHAIVDVIREAFPGHAVLGEESHHDDVGAEDLWVVDPLDGTNNFAHEIPHFAISIAYHRGGRPECGVVYSPVRGDWFVHGIHGIRRFGTASLDLCMVGVGAFGAFFEYELSPWDFAAGRLFVEEAGGRVTTCRGEEIPLSKTTVLASNGHVHEAMLAVVGPHAPSSGP
ncbi:MAG: inositol monophosphatase family protein [Planctomycetota bacterium]|jgi:myo-inositol-1(or 4)-monophosphatase